MTRSTPNLSAAFLLLFMLGACCGAPAGTTAPTAPPTAPASAVAPPATAAPSATASTAAPEPVDPVAARATQLLDRAQAAEPAVTALLKQLAAELGGEMVKLEHRLKTRASTERKLRKLAAGQTGVDVGAISLEDSLRYTMRIDDEPAGHYLEVLTKTLQQLDQKGHRVARLKNYWLRDDNYSGVNSVLAAPDGMEWELQFHTTASLQTQDATHAWYEEFRRPDTTLERRRELFDLMTKSWNEVPVPKGVLGPDKIHPRAIRRERPRP